MIREKRHLFLRNKKSGIFLAVIVLLMIVIVAGGCSKKAKQAPREAEVTVTTVKQANTPVAFEFVAQTQSSHEVQIRARVSGFLEKRVYTEGTVVS